mmetsp:Transcript_32899/g.50930  ORF Transcript_32899/g.50930 Transcript_32899/m.50930 type:complete len:251 (-) Transcript_32899:116-868(-)
MSKAKKKQIAARKARARPAAKKKPPAAKKTRASTRANEKVVSWESAAVKAEEQPAVEPATDGSAVDDVDDSCPAYTQFSFQFVDPEAPEGEYMSASSPGYWLRLSDPEEQLKYLQRPDEIVIDAPAIRVAYQYPFSGSFEFSEAAPDPCAGFSRSDLLATVAERYRKMYDEEIETATGPVGDGSGAFRMNRMTTNGKYGISGHDLGDLNLHTIMKAPDGIWLLGLDSCLWGALRGPKQSLLPPALVEEIF